MARTPPESVRARAPDPRHQEPVFSPIVLTTDETIAVQLVTAPTGTLPSAFV
ncbi:hypothetical protein LX15_006213, partial [Streptoalloteichus tenebrarius]|nr:hypothetical protein [Streptoalloteichus tenebrarius]